MSKIDLKTNNEFEREFSKIKENVICYIRANPDMSIEVLEDIIGEKYKIHLSYTTIATIKTNIEKYSDDKTFENWIRENMWWKIADITKKI